MSWELKSHGTPDGSGGAAPAWSWLGTQMARDYLRERLYGNSKQGFVDMKPYPSQIIQVGSKTKFKTHKNPLSSELWPGVIQAEKQAEKERSRRRHKRKQRRPSDLTLPSSNAIFQRPSAKDGNVSREYLTPSLQRAGSYEHDNRSRAEHSSPRRHPLYESEDEPSVEDMRRKRAAIVLGELERVIPPSKSALEELRAAARPHPLTWATLSGPIHTSFPSPDEVSPPNSSPLSPQHQHKSTPSSSYSSAKHLAAPRRSLLSNLANPADPPDGGHRRSALSSLALSAELLDSTRRTITSAIRRSAEKTVHSFSHRGSDSATYPSDDDKSFYCIGERLPPTFHHSESVPSSVSSFTSSAHSPGLGLGSSKVDSRQQPSPKNKGVWMDAETECRLCKRKCPEGPRGLCSSYEEDFTRPVTRYVDFPSYDQIEPILPLRIEKVAAKTRGAENNSNQLPPLNSTAKAIKLVSIFDQDPGPAPAIPLPKIPTMDEKMRTGESGIELQVQPVGHRATVDESPGYTSEKAVVQSVLQTAMSLPTKNRLMTRKKLESMTAKEDEGWQPPDLRMAYNNTAKIVNTNTVARENNTKETVPTSGANGGSEEMERRGSLTRGSENRRRPNSRGEGIKPDEGIVRRDTSFYSFYDEILADAKERSARRRDG